MIVKEGLMYKSKNVFLIYTHHEVEFLKVNKLIGFFIAKILFSHDRLLFCVSSDLISVNHSMTMYMGKVKKN